MVEALLPMAGNNFAMKLFIIALAPVAIIAGYVYFRDKYEREPIGQLVKALIAGCLVAIPVLFVGDTLESFLVEGANRWNAFYTAFVIASFNEELFKFIFLMILFWSNKHFNEKFDGIVYAVFISLGFAAVENVMYVLNYGEAVGYSRAVLSVPAHALFGVSMGFYLGLAKFYRTKMGILLLKAFVFPVLLHGIFDFILMLGNMRLMVMFLPFVIYLYFDGLRKMKNLSDRSIYNSDVKSTSL